MSEPTELSTKQLKQHLQGAEPNTVTVQQLQQHLSEFQEYLDIDAVVPTLKQAELLNDREAWDLTNREYSPQDRVTKLLTFIINRKGIKGPDRLIECIRLTSDCHLQHGRLVRLFSGKEQDVNSSALETCKLRWKKEAFANLVRDVYDRMQVNIVNGNLELGSFKVFVATSPVSAKYPEYSLLQEDTEAMMRADNLASVFLVLNRYWNYQNLYILERVMREYIGDVSANMLLLQYQKKMEAIDAIDTSKENISRKELHLESSIKSRIELVLSERFSKLLQIVLETFKQLQVSMEELKIFLSFIIRASNLNDLAMTCSLEDIFCTLLKDCIGWDNYGTLLQIVERFGDEHSKLLVRNYNQDYQSFKFQRPCSNSGSWLFHNTVPFISEYEREALDKQVTIHCSQFADIVVRSRELSSSAKQFIANLSASNKYPTLVQPFSAIATDGATLSEIFIHLNHFGWNYTHYHLLQALVEKYGSLELRSSLHTYVEKLSRFEETTTLANFLWVLPRGKPPLRPRFVQMSLSLNVNLQEYTLQELSKFRTSFMNTFDLHPCALIMYTAKVSGLSFKLKFLIPSGVDCLLLLESKEKASFFHNHKISKVKLYEKGYYYFMYVIDSECSPVEKMKTEAEGTRNLGKKLQEFRAQIQ